MEKREADKTWVIVKLGLWLIFIVVLVIFTQFGGNKNNNVNKNETEEINEEIKVEISYIDKLKKLVNNYKYVYEIKIDNDIFVYEGNLLENDFLKKESGSLKQNGEHKFDYFLENGYTYQVNNGGLDKIETIYDQRINTNNINVGMLSIMLPTLVYKFDGTKYSYELKNQTIDVYVNDENVEKIEIFESENYYKIKLENIGEITEITY